MVNGYLCIGLFVKRMAKKSLRAEICWKENYKILCAKKKTLTSYSMQSKYYIIVRRYVGRWSLICHL